MRKIKFEHPATKAITFTYGNPFHVSMAFTNSPNRYIPMDKYANLTMAQHLMGWMISAYMNLEIGLDGKETRETTQEEEETRSWEVPLLEM